MVVSCLTWVLGVEFSSFERASGTLNFLSRISSTFYYLSHMWVYVSACGYIFMSLSAHMARDIRFLELELQMLVGHQI